MKNLSQINCVALTSLESQQINGGTNKFSFWEEIALTSGAIVNGLAVFASSGGKNAGLCVK